MNFGLYMSPSGEFANVRVLADLAKRAEDGGWNGLFLYDSIQPFGPGTYEPLVDPWGALMAIALSTERIRFGPLITPLARRRAAKVARECVTLDHVSGGRMILGVGVGYVGEGDPEFAAMGEEADLRIRAEMLDEGLEVLTGLWTGEPFAFRGKYNHLEETVFIPGPVQTPRIPIWVAGFWPNKPPMRRAARFDGIFQLHPDFFGGGVLSTSDIRTSKLYVDEHRSSSAPIDVIFASSFPDNHPNPTTEVIADYQDAGVTWWLENFVLLEQARKRAQEGPRPTG
jgi:alkanesulfonate monooxygenase SsuD/methylene tetrahydromethanopterin reductase-like flavin-dependent oxidoreductase (luciferase family)